MSYLGWSRVPERNNRKFHEKAYKRQGLAKWDAMWQKLSDQARFFVIHEVKFPAKSASGRQELPSVPAKTFPRPVLDELLAAGFIAYQQTKGKAATDRVVAPEPLLDFLTRLRMLHRMHLLDDGQPTLFASYVDYAFYNSETLMVLGGVMRKASIEDHTDLTFALKRYVMSHRWPGWVAKYLDDQLAKRVIDVCMKANGPIPLAVLPTLIKGSDPDKVRATVDQLISHLALVEDLQPETWTLMIGFLPAVREDLRLASQPRVRPPLVVCEHPKETAHAGNILLNDIRAALLEVAGDPPRLRQDRALFSKESDRFLACLEPLPEWLMEALKWSRGSRVNEAFNWAKVLQLVKEVSEGKQTSLNLSPKGEQWLASGLETQHKSLHDYLITITPRPDPYGSRSNSAVPLVDSASADYLFLGSNILAQKPEKETKLAHYWIIKAETLLHLRRHIDKALSQLPPGVFHRVDSIMQHLTFEKHNPLYLGLAFDQVDLSYGARPIPPLEEQREEAGRIAIDAFIRRRLIPHGAVQAAIDADGMLCIARGPRYDAYFGRKMSQADLASAEDTTAKVVIQPDFSVIIIGLNPAPAAELAPFCIRATQSGGHGALVLKITRDSVVKAVTHGLTPTEIIARLKRHATHEIPNNVLREVEGWSNWVRRITPGTLTILRCPDRDTADRVLAALKSQAERLTDTIVGIDVKKLSSTERNKLKAHGIIVTEGL
jgi:hypothetical protein